MPDPKKKLKQAITSNYKKRGIDVSKFKKFDIEKDTIVQGKSKNLGVAFKKAKHNKNMAGLSLNNATSGRASGNRAFPKDQRITQGKDARNYKVQEVYNKSALKKSITPTNFKSNDEKVANKIFGGKK